jgi:mRNA interferase MazF
MGGGRALSGVFDRGAVLIVNLDPTVGHEQSGKRPCIVVMRKERVARQRFPIVVVVPVTSTGGLDPLYPVVQPYAHGLTRPSTVLIDMIRGIDVKEPHRLVGALAPLPPPDLRRVDVALRDFLGL